MTEPAAAAPPEKGKRREKDDDLFSMSWAWIKGTLLQSVGIGGIATVFTALFWTAGYLIVVRRSVTFGIPNANSTASAYQQAGADWAIDVAGAIRAALVGAGWMTVLLVGAGLTAAFVLLRIGLRRKLTARQRAGVTAALIAFHVAMAAVLVKDSLDVLQYLEASNVTVRERHDLLTLRETNPLAGRFLDAFVHNDASPVLADYHRRLTRYLWIGIVGIFGAWAIHRNFKPSKAWKRRIIGAQAGLALLLVVHTGLLAQMYGLITAITHQRCVLVQFRPELAKALEDRREDDAVRGLIVSDLVFAADEIHVMRFGFPNQLFVFGRADIIRYDFQDRLLCGQMRL